MVEQGFEAYVQAGLAALTPSLTPPGGYGGQLPPDKIGTGAGQVAQAWMHRSISASPDYNLQTETGWTEWIVEIQCHGTTMALAQQLAKAIKSVLRNGFKGNFTDPDSTLVFGIYRLPTQVDGYSDANRSFVRTIEFCVQYDQAN